MENLFAQKRVEDYFKQIERRCKNDIDNYNESHLASLDIMSTSEQIFQRYLIEAPEIVKEKTKTYISTTEVTGYQLPSGTMFERGRMYPIEIANYEIPFSGDSELFHCVPTSFSPGLIQGEVKSNRFILIQLTTWGKIAGIEKAENEIKASFLNYLERIENNLNALKVDVERFLPILKANIQEYLSKKASQVKQKIESSDRLNPFK